MSRVVSDTGPLISLEKITDGYAFLRKLYGQVLVPPAVLDELVRGQHESAEAYLKQFGIAELLRVETPTALRAETEHLDRGEREALELAAGLGLPLLIEEEAGRQAARRLGLSFSGIAGQLLKAARTGLVGVEEAIRKLQELRSAGRINLAVYEAVRDAIEKEAR